MSPTESNIDIQCQKILTGIKSTLGLLRDDLMENILEITENVNSKEKFGFLKRLERSLGQYVKRDRNLVYIGFLGHFSSGKSSTINSVLQLNGTSNERSANINPTDNQITLISDSKNQNQVVRLLRVGDVPVVIDAIDDVEFLKNKIIMDTPGSGDPGLVEEIVRDSLPMCDLLVYCLSATNPLDTSDIPLILEKEKNLNELPTIYVVTRGDEFRKDPLKTLDSNNYDENAAKKAMLELASRMKETFQTVDLEYDDFIVIDNKSNYNIDALIREIESISDKKNQQNLIQLHSHKVEFFLRTTRKIKSFFVDVINKKLETIDSYYFQAKTKNDEYDRKTLIGSDRLTNNWLKTDEAIRGIIEGALGQNNQIFSSLATPESLFDSAQLDFWWESCIDSIRLQSNRFADSLRSELNSKIYDLSEEYKGELRKGIEENGSLKKSDLNVFLSDLVEKKLEVSLELKIEYLKQYEMFVSASNEYLRVERYQSLSATYNSLRKRLGKNSPLERVENNIEDAKKVLTEILQTFYDAVDTYKVAAFSSEAKKYIENLGLSNKLDNIDSEPVDEDILFEQVRTELFGKLIKEIVSYKAACQNINTKLSGMKIDQPIFQDHENGDKIKGIENTVSSKGKSDILQIINDGKSDFKDHLLEKVDEINADIYSKEEEQKGKVREINRRRLHFYIKYLTPAIIFLVASISGFWYFIPEYGLVGNDLSMGFQWLLGISSNATFSVLNFLLVKVKDDYPDQIIQAKNKYREEEKRAAAKIVDDGFHEFSNNFVKNVSNDIAAYLLDIQKKDMLSLVSKSNNSIIYDLHGELYLSESKVKNCIKDYSLCLTSLKNTVSQTLVNNQRNNEVLTRHSKEIKTISISPSFMLLENTRAEITEAQRRIKGLDFS